MIKIIDRKFKSTCGCIKYFIKTTEKWWRVDGLTEHRKAERGDGFTEHRKAERGNGTTEHRNAERVKD